MASAQSTGIKRLYEGQFNMKNEIINGIKAAFIAITVALSTALIFPSPSIQFDRIEHDFGTVPEDTIQRCEFTFKNTGSGTLVIERVSAG